MITTILTAMKVHALWLFISIIMVTLAMTFDLITGVRKANRNGKATTSSGLRRTCTKAYKYYLPILCAACFDLLFCQMPFYTLPFLSMLISAYCILCEIKSVIENTNDKDSTKEAAETIIEIIKKKDNPDELLQMIVDKLKA